MTGKTKNVDYDATNVSDMRRASTTLKMASNMGRNYPEDMEMRGDPQDSISVALNQTGTTALSKKRHGASRKMPHQANNEDSVNDIEVQDMSLTETAAGGMATSAMGLN